MSIYDKTEAPRRTSDLKAITKEWPIQKSI